MNQPDTRLVRCSVALFLAAVLYVGPACAGELEPGTNVEIPFLDPALPPSLYSVVTGDWAPPTLTVRLPTTYDPNKKYPLLVYVPGFHGGPKGNIGNAQTIVDPEEWIVASVPLFKKAVDRDEISGGIIVGFEDAPTIAQAYGMMLGSLFELAPNIDPERSAMVGFSNGALTIAVLVSSHDEFALTHFKSFCLVDQGMMHLTDLHKHRARDSRYLILSGDNQEDLGRDLKIRGGQLLQDSWRLVGVDLQFRIMKNTGHEFKNRHMALVGKWLRNEALPEDEIIAVE